MTYEQKFAALCALTETSLQMRKPGDWFVSATGRNVKDGGMLRGTYGNGKSPEEAIEDDWRQIAQGGTIVVIGDCREVTWNGFMWEDAK